MFLNQKLTVLHMLFSYAALTFWLAVLWCAPELRAQSRPGDSTRVRPSKPPVAYPVKLQSGDTLWVFRQPIGSFTAEERAKALQRNLQELLGDTLLHRDSVLTVDDGVRCQVVYKGRVLTSFTNADRTAPNQTRCDVARNLQKRILWAIDHRNDPPPWFEPPLAVLLLIVVVVGWWWGVSTWIRGLQERILRRRKDWLKGYTIRNYTLLKPHQQYRLIKTALLSVKWSLFLAGLFIGLPYVFSLYPSTRPIARQVVEWTTVPLVTIGGKILDYLPNLFTITLLIIILRAVLQLVAYFSREVQSEALKLKGFHADWARPTFLIFRAIWLLFGLTVIFPYLPGANSAAFQGVSVFLGVLLSLGSSAAISNLVAGLVMIYMRSFEPGDRIRTGDLEGIVLEKSLLVTRLRTFLNEEITIPNQALLNGHITNYSRSARECGLWIQTEVTIGYDVPWQQVHELLVRAALQTADIEREPVPFVVQTALNDFYVAYRVHARTRQTGFLVELHSRLHATIQDVFFAAGVEICSPHFHAFRDGNGVQMPPEFRPGASIRNNTQGYSPQNPQSGKGSAD